MLSGLKSLALPFLLIVLVPATNAAGQVSATAAAPATDASVLQEPGNSLICGGDLVHVAVLGVPEFDRDVRVSDSGTITLPMAGQVKIAGSTVAQAEKLVSKTLQDAHIFVDPQVTLLVKEFAAMGVSVLGEVQKPGVYSMPGSHTLFDAISMAGGLTAKAGKAVTISHRGAPAKTATVTIKNGPDGDASGNVPISPGDTVVVSKAGMVYVVGDVRLPTGIVLDQPDLTVLQALSIAQGANNTAALNGARVLRKSPDGVQQIPVPLKEILAAKKPDVPLKPEDVLFIPTSAAKSAARRSVEAILQAATGVVIYRR